MVTYIDILPQDIRVYIYCISNSLRKHDNIVRFIKNNFEYQYHHSDYFFDQELAWSRLKVSRRKLCNTGVLVECRTYKYYPGGDARTLENVTSRFAEVTLYHYDNILNSPDPTETTLELYNDYLSCVKAIGYIDFSYGD